MKKSFRIAGSFRSLASLCFAIAAASCSMFSDSGDPGGESVSSISFNQTALSIPRGGVDLLAIRINPPDAQEKASLSWEFDPSVVSLVCDNYGAVVTGLQAGSTAVRVKTDGIAAACVVTVTSDALAPQAAPPYVYMSADLVKLAPGSTERVDAALFGGLPSDVGGFSFSIDKPSIASLYSEGNYLWITGLSEGDARIAARHTKAAFPYTFLVSCHADDRDVPFITTASNVITIDKSLGNSALLSVDVRHPLSPDYADMFSYAITDADGSPLADPPVSIAGAGASQIITPLAPGECFVKVENSQASHPLFVLVRVVEPASAVYIEPSSALVQIAGASSQTVSASLANLPDGAEPSPDFDWSVPDNDVIDAHVFNGSAEGKGDRLWITGKKQGALKISISHPLSPLPRDIVVMVSDIAAEAANASIYITTGQNFIKTKAGAPDTTIAVTLNNAADADVKDLSWHIDNAPADGGGAPVIAYIAGTGYSSSTPSPNARAAHALVPSASGYATISPLRAGSATIAISHPKAVYSTKILVSVLDASAQDEPTLVLSSPLPIPYLTLKNGDSLSLDIILSGAGKTPADDAAIHWSASPGLSLNASSSSASVAAIGSGVARETVSASHPKARHPFEFAILRYDTDEQLLSAKTLLLHDRYRVLPKGAQDWLSASIAGAEDGDALSWSVTSGLNSVVSFEQESNARAKISALQPGSASIAVSFANQSSSFEIVVQDDGVVDASKPAYLSTMDNVTLMSAGETAAISVLPVNISASRYGGIQWTASDPALIDIAPNGDRAAVHAKAEGKASISVSHPSAANVLELFVHIGGQYEYKNTDVAYISTPSDALVLRSGGESVPLRPALVRAASEELQTSGFSFAVKDSAVVSIEASSSSAVVSPSGAGQTVVTISHPLAAFSKDVVVIVDGSAQPIPYVTSSQNVVAVLQGEYAAVTASLANAAALNPADWSWSVQDASVASVIAGAGGAAMIAGGAPGSTVVSVANKSAPLPLSIIVITLDRQSALQNPWIKTSANIVTLKKGSSQTITAELIGGAPSDAAAFLWSVHDPLAVLLSPSQNQASVRGVAAGQTYVTVRNANHPDAYPKTVLVIVEDAVQDDCFVTVNQQIVKMKPDDSSGATLKAALANGSPLDAEQFVWWADDYKIVSLSSITDSALIRPAGVSGSTAVHVKHPKALLPADIIVLVGAFDSFAFASPSLSLCAGSLAFVSMQVPALDGGPTVAYESANPAVAAVSGANAVAMIAGVRPGSTTITATLKNASGAVATADIAVIVSPPAPNANAISSPSPLLTVERGETASVSAAISGPDIGPQDKWSLSWTSSDPAVASVAANGGDAVLSAKAPGEAVVSISHPKAPSPFSIWVKVPDVKEKSLSLDQSYIELFKNDGNVIISATIYNGSAADYNSISWSATRQGGVQVVSLMNASGKTCAVIPRNAGLTTLSAQLPNGQKAECLVNVVSDALLSLNTQTVRVNPHYSETARYAVLPENAAVTWFAQADGAANPSAVFDFSVDPNEKTVTVTGNSLGSGTINGYIASTSGAKMVALRVYVEHTYLFSFTNSTYHSRHTPDEPPFTYTFKVFPPDLKVAASSSRPDALSVPPYAAVDPLTGIGSLTCAPLGEASDVVVSFTGYPPDGGAPIPEASGERVVDVMYGGYTIIPTFDLQAGSFSEYRGGVLYLGDGEEMVFSLSVAEPKAALNVTKIEWRPPPGATPDVRDDAANGGLISVSRDGPEGSNRFRVKHAVDHTDLVYNEKGEIDVTKTKFFLIAKDMSYTATNTYSNYVRFPYKTYPFSGDSSAAYDDFMKDHTAISVFQVASGGEYSPPFMQQTTAYVKPDYLTNSNERRGDGPFYTKQTGSQSKSFNAKNREGVKQWLAK
jgi:hypothetical protein